MQVVGAASAPLYSEDGGGEPVGLRPSVCGE